MRITEIICLKVISEVVFVYIWIMMILISFINLSGLQSGREYQETRQYYSPENDIMIIFK